MRAFLLAASASAILAAPGPVAPQHIGWPSGIVHHSFFDTPKGQLHYVTRGLAGAEEPLVYLHSHPRSSSEFQYIAQELGEKAVIAIDWFGMGYSEDYQGNSTDDFCQYEEFTGYVLDILAQEKVKRFVPTGFLKGAHPSVELAAQAGPERVSKVALMGALILNPDQQSYIENVLVPAAKNPTLYGNGSHLISEWANPDSTDAIYPEELLWNQDKTNDALRGLLTNWQMHASWAAYNEKLPSRLAEVDQFAKTLVVHPMIAYTEWSAYGLDPAFSLAKMDEIFVHKHNMSVYADLDEGTLYHNASYLAYVLESFLDSHNSDEVIV